MKINLKSSAFPFYVLKINENHKLSVDSGRTKPLFMTFIFGVIQLKYSLKNPGRILKTLWKAQDFQDCEGAQTISQSHVLRVRKTAQY